MIVGFCNHAVEIFCDGKKAIKLLEFLCHDLPQESSPHITARFELSMEDRAGQYSFNKDGTSLFTGSNLYELAYTIINEILYYTIVDNSSGLALHSAAIVKEDVAILLPGKSGTGKSTLAAWLLAQGCNYLTDELVVLGGSDFCIIPFTRPLSIKSGALPALRQFVDYSLEDVISDKQGVMLPHRMLNPHFKPSMLTPKIILFPVYDAKSEASLQEVSAARGCAMLLESYVNARNISQHGIGLLADLARSTSIYKLQYGRFAALPPLLRERFPALFGDIRK